jgi:cellulase
MSLSKMAPSFASILALIGTAAAHGHITGIVHNGVLFEGYNPQSFPYMSPPPAVAGWSADQMDNGFVSPDAYGTADIICHRSATNAKAHIQVAAGDSITLQWTEWPESHHGPIFDHLAACNGNCEDADKTALEFFRIDGVGLVEPGTPGKWGSDVMIENGNTWTVQIPSNIKAGNYVLRHDTIALHSGYQDNGAQNYPQCINLEITGSGSDVPAGTLGTELFKREDANILFNIYQTGTEYIIPGGDLISGAVESVAQGSPVVTATSSATTPGAAAVTLAPTTPDEPATTPAPVEVTPTSTPDAVATPSSTSPSAPDATPPATGCARRRRRALRRALRN